MHLLNFSAVTDKGRLRDNNEDCYLSRPDNGLWLIADGMGGHEAGEVASAIVKEQVDEGFNSSMSLDKAIHSAHQAVLSAVQQGQGAPGMGSTVVALKSFDSNYEVAWVGDSRAYLWSFEQNGGSLEQLTTDHSYVQMLLASGVIKAEEVATHPEKNVITQCLGSPELEELQVDVVQGRWDKKQWILLCSDGLTDEVSDRQIAEILCQSHSPREATDELLKTALNNGGRDNVTVQVIESPHERPTFVQRCANGLPKLTTNSTVDKVLYGLGLVCIISVLSWIIS